MIIHRRTPPLTWVYLHLSEFLLVVARGAVAHHLASPRLLSRALKTSNRLSRAALRAWRRS